MKRINVHLTDPRQTAAGFYRSDNGERWKDISHALKVYLSGGEYFILSNIGATLNINNGCVPLGCFQCQGPAIVHAGSLAHLNETEPSLIQLITPAPFLLQQIKMSAVREVYFPDRLLSRLTVPLFLIEGHCVPIPGLNSSISCFPAPLYRGD